MDDLDTSQIRNPLLGIARGVTTWVDAHPDEVAEAIQEYLLDSAKKRKKIKAFDRELPSLPDEPQPAHDYRVALESGHTESAAKLLLAKHWGITGVRKFNTRYRKASRAHAAYDKLRWARNAKQQSVSDKIDPPNEVSIGQRVIQLVACVDALVAEDVAGGAWLGLHSLSDRLGIVGNVRAEILLAVERAQAKPSQVVVSWEKVCERFTLDTTGRKIGQSTTTGQQFEVNTPPPAPQQKIGGIPLEEAEERCKILMAAKHYTKLPKGNNRRMCRREVADHFNIPFKKHHNGTASLHAMEEWITNNSPKKYYEEFRESAEGREWLDTLRNKALEEIEPSKVSRIEADEVG